MEDGRVQQSVRLRTIATKMASLLEPGDKDVETPVPGFMLLQRTHPTGPEPVVHETGLSVIVRGHTRVVLGKTTSFSYDSSRFLVTAMGIPTVTQVLEGSPEQPYLAVFLKLDLHSARQMMADIDASVHGTRDGEPSSSSTFALGPVDEELLGAVERVIDLLSKPQDIPVLSELLHREILYRVLTSPAGEQLRAVVRAATSDKGVTRAVSWLRENYAEPLSVTELAHLTGMSVSTLYRKFTTVTGTTPLQFQKLLRLHEARRLMLTGEADALAASVRVGYVSSAQFSREYKRVFGSPPRRHIKLLRAASPRGPGRTEVQPAG